MNVHQTNGIKMNTKELNKILFKELLVVSSKIEDKDLSWQILLDDPVTDKTVQIKFKDLVVGRTKTGDLRVTPIGLINSILNKYDENLRIGIYYDNNNKYEKIGFLDRYGKPLKIE